MNGYTPWELSLLKRKYHRYDDEHKGYLDRENLRCLAAAAGIGDAEPLVDSVLFEMDGNHDGEVTFEELALYLATASSPEAAQLRRHFLSTEASAVAGATMGILPVLKAKAFAATGAFFADPVRLFRDYYVEYTTSVRTHAAAGGATKGGFRAAWARVGLLSGTGWLLFSVTLDSLVGASMFLTYAYARAKLANAVSRHDELRNHLRLSKLHTRGSHAEGAATGDQAAQRAAAVLRHSSQFALEAASGCIAGAVSGVLEAPAQALAASHLRPREIGPALRRYCFKWHWRILRAAGSHAAFFAGFHEARVALGYAAHDVAGLHHTTFTGACLTAISGCAAGGAYRLVAVPIDNYSAIVRHGTAAEHRALPAAQRRAVLFRGLGRSLAMTMPVTGLAFLGYEYALMYW